MATFELGQEKKRGAGRAEDQRLLQADVYRWQWFKRDPDYTSMSSSIGVCYLRLTITSSQQLLKPTTGFLTAKQQSDYTACIHRSMKEATRDEDAYADHASHECEAQVLARLHKCFCVRPHHVMGTRSELGILKGSTVWSDLMEGA